MATIVPYFSYADAAAAIAFLENAFGFTTRQRYDADDGTVMHAELSHGDGVIMIGTAEGATHGSPGTYVVVADVDDHHAKAVAAGAEVVHGPQDTPFGTRRWRGRDREGHEWSFGTYQPKA